MFRPLDPEAGGSAPARPTVDGSTDGSFPYAQLSPGSFRADGRYAAALPATPPPEPVPDAEDPVALAYARGHAAGSEQAYAEAEQRFAADCAARNRLEFAFARLDAAMAESLRQKLCETVAALCETALLPLALDMDALARRAEAAVAMLGRADDERVVRLHPDDLSLVAPRLCTDWTIVPDPALERGALRIETPGGGVEDGPGEWRRAIAEVIGQC